MKFSSKLTNQILELMEEIQDSFLLKKTGSDTFIFNTFPDENVTNGDPAKGFILASERSKILETISDLDILKIDKVESVEDKFPETRYSIKLNKEKFEKFYKKLSSDTFKSSTPEGGMVFYLDNDGNFWHDPKDKFCYPMGKTSERLKILSYLVDNSGYQSPKVLSEYLNGKNTQTIRTEVRKIRDNIAKFLGIKGKKEVIDSKQDSGYRINPKHKVFRVKT